MLLRLHAFAEDLIPVPMKARAFVAQTNGGVHPITQARCVSKAMPHDAVIRLARGAHQKHERGSGDARTDDQLAAALAADELSGG